MTGMRRPALLAAIAVAVLTLGLLLGPGPAFAVTVDIRADIAAPNGRVTLGDLFEDAGAAGEVVVATGGQAGGSLVLDARHVQSLAAAHGLDWTNGRGLNRLIARVETSPPPQTGRRRGAEVLTYARDFAAGEIVEAEDIVWAAPAAKATCTISSFLITLGAERSARDTAVPALSGRRAAWPITARASRGASSGEPKPAGAAQTMSSASTISPAAKSRA